MRVVLNMLWGNKRLSVQSLRVVLVVLSGLCVALGLVMGTQGWSCCEDLRSHNPMMEEIIWQLRMPRSLGAWLSGALLGLAGMLAQGLFRNPLADPFLLGSASGASLGVTLALLMSMLSQVGGEQQAHLMGQWMYTLLQAGAFIWQGLGIVLRWLFIQDSGAMLFQLGITSMAFIGAVLAVLLTLSLARGVLHTHRLLLSGVVVGVILGSLNNLILQRHPSLLGALQNFLLGSVAHVDQEGCWVMTLVLLVCFGVSRLYSPLLDGLTLGEHTAKSLGFRLGLERSILIAVLSLATASAVAQTGLIAFVGLAAPHMVRQLVKTHYKAWLELSMWMGGLLLVGSDLLARWLSGAQELPIGIVTALLGGLYLLRLLSKNNPSSAMNSSNH